MPPEQLTSYVRKRLRTGYPGGELKNELLLQGYSADVVEQAFMPRRVFDDPSEGFGVRQFWAPAVFLLLGLTRVRYELWFHFAVGCIVTGFTCFLISMLRWHEQRGKHNGLF